MPSAPIIDELREKYLNMAPYSYDVTVKSHFTDQEIDAIEKYGHWFEAIWRDQVPLVTDKLRHFYLAKNRLCDSRTKMEDLWFRYTKLKFPF